ncbi:sensor domain-containing diguanylate cyclase [Dethiothermospora halolimnae]|uniref:sensor domain-containing diguanylate cyclase n=1 Tax=Dethiothermospora halolimnae TaxID=3114390 RepID=UPI003CCB9094
MRLTNKMLFMIAGYSFVVILGLCLVSDNIIMDSFEELEQKYFLNEGKKTKAVFENAISVHEGLLLDWARWDDSYEFINGNSGDYIKRNITPSVFEYNDIDYIVILNEHNKVLVGYKYNKKERTLGNVDGALIEEMSKFKNINDIIIFSGKSIVISTSEISDTNREKTPKGLIVFGYDLDENKIEEIGNKLNLNITVNNYVKDKIKDDFFINNLKDRGIIGFQMPYLNDKSLMEVRVTIPKEITKLGEITTKDFLIFFSIALFILTLILFLGIERIVVSRLFKLRRVTHNIAYSKDLSKRLSIKGNDEIAALKNDINYMLDKIETMNNELTEYATMDMLTGVLNRRVGIKLLKKYIDLSRTNDIPLTIAYIDVNGLKEVNDKQGHKMGDKLLNDISGIINSNIRKSDKLCRLGGDEFLIIFPDTDYNSAKDAFKRIESVVNDTNKRGVKPYNIGFSKGIVEYDKVLDLEEFLDLADKYMYKEKMEIKDRYRDNE